MYSSGSVARSLTKRTQAGWSANVSNSSSGFALLHERPDKSKVDDASPWSCDDDYKYPIQESLTDPWEQCHDIVQEFDEDMINGLKEEVSNLLVVASLFLAIVTAFVIESSKWLQPDPSDRSANILSQIVQLLNNSNDATVNRVVQPLNDFQPSYDTVTINQLWFLSLTQSLSAVVLGTLCLQWLSSYTHLPKTKTRYESIALRQMRYEGLIGWGLPRVPAILLLNVQAALILFAIGLIWYLWTLHKDVAFPVGIVAAVTMFLLTLTTLAPVLQSFLGWIYPPSLAMPQCPFKSPISFILDRLVLMLTVVGSYFVQWFGGRRFRKNVTKWRGEQIPLLVDTQWERHDILWQGKREARLLKEHNIQSEGLDDSDRYSHYLVKGLAGVMDALIAKPSAAHIVHNCLQEVNGATAQAKTFMKLFRLEENFTKDEEMLLETAAIDGIDMYSLRKDFLSAHVLQYFVEHNDQLHKTVLKHRVELFIRVHNTARKYGVDIGKTIKCPITRSRDPSSMSMGSRRQFIECIQNMLTDRRVCYEELAAVQIVIKSIDVHAHITSKFNTTIRQFVLELNSWRAYRGGSAVCYNQTIQVIRGHFPWIAEYLEGTKDELDLAADEKYEEARHEHVHVDWKPKPETGKGHKQSGKGNKSESQPLMPSVKKASELDGMSFTGSKGSAGA